MRITHCAGLIAAAVAIQAAMPQRSFAQAMDEWQVHLANGSYVYELQLKTLGATEVLFEHHGTAVQLPLSRIDELRRIHKSFKHGTGGARATFGGLAGADDDVVQLSQYSVAEKHDILANVLSALAAEGSVPSGQSKRSRR